MSRPILLTFLAALVLAFAAQARDTGPVVISIDRMENIYLNNAPISDITQLAQIHRSPVYIRVDKDVRFQAMCRVFEALPNGTISSPFLGQPKTMGKAIPAALNRGIEELGSAQVTTKVVGTSWPAEPGAIIFLVDFDGTITLNGNQIIRAALDQKLTELAANQSHSHVYIAGNRLAKVDTIETVAASAKRSGFADITIVCQVS